MPSFYRRAISVIAALGVVAGPAATAGADEIVNDVPVVSSVKQATITAGGAGVVVKYRILQTDDPASSPECDATVNSSTPLSLAVNAVSGVSASPTAVSWSQAECRDSVEKSITFNSSTPGAYSITHTVTWTAKGGGARTMTNSTAFSLIVQSAPPADGAAPAITFGATPNGSDGWFNTSPATATVTATDPSGVTTLECTLAGTPVALTSVTTSTTTMSGVVSMATDGSRLVSCGATDGATPANTTASADRATHTLKLDATAPTVTGVPTSSPNGDGWYNADVEIVWSCSDATSGLAVGCPTTSSVSSEGFSQAVSSGDIFDNAGNKTNVASTAVNLDKTDPTISLSSTTPDPNTNGWNNTTVTVTWTCDDQLSGVPTSTTTASVSAEGADLSAIGTCYDLAGNSASDTKSGINIDRTAPNVTVNGVTSGTVYTLGNVPAVSCTTTDQSGLSGVETTASLSWSGAGTTNPNGVGSFTATCSGATDKAGNAAASVSKTFSVRYPSGAVRFLQPINNTGHDLGNNPDVSTFKAGSTVPVKIQVQLAAGTVLQPASASWITPRKGGSTFEAVDEQVYSELPSSGSTFTWNATDGFHQYNWGTSKTGSGFYWLIGARLDDGQVYTVYISLR